MAVLGIVFRFVFATIWCGSLYYDIRYQPRLGFEWYIYKLVMLTNLNFVSVLLSLSFSSKNLSFSFTFNKKSSANHSLQITCALFWVLYAIEPELVMPHWVAQLIPAWLNHVTHTLPIVYVMGELLLFDGEHPARRSSMSMAFMHIFIYFVIIYAVRVVDKYWLYPLLELLSVELHVVVFIVSVVGYYWLIKLSTTLSSCFRGLFIIYYIYIFIIIYLLVTLVLSWQVALHIPIGQLQKADRMTYSTSAQGLANAERRTIRPRLHFRRQLTRQHAKWPT
ncbi:unnamed protein product [Heligmosomoides polygyrus]|uniref:Transmembrane protein n=1 Tax=Heligmosomoides polygyrus TaxID=6339 RepID=A0A183G0H1_HELPZ|nr:unnamed protein product [Heligmosomoides polygyrus]